MSKNPKDGASNQRRIGVILSYILLALNMFVGIILTPIIVGSLGNREYGLYQTIASFARNLAILDFGIGTTITRYLSKYKALNDDDNRNKVLLAVARLTCILSGIILILGILLSLFIPQLYSRTLTVDELQKAQTVFLILVVNVSITLFDHYLVGVCTSNERFLFINTNKILKVIFRVILIVILVRRFPNAIVLSEVDLFITVLFLIVDFIYVRLCLRIRIVRTQISHLMLKEIVIFGSTIFLQAFVNQANSNVDKVLLGALSSAEVVAIYSVAMQLFGIFNSLSSVISSVYLPYVTKKVHSGVSAKEIDDIIIRTGRKQFMITGLVLVGFIAVGKDFITIWMGKDYIEAWIIALIIMIPSMVELVENVAISVTLAMGKNVVRTIIIACAAVFNIVFTIIFIKLFGPIGAPIATALSYLLGYIIAVNIFYKKIIGIDVIYVFRNIFKRTWFCLAITGLVTMPLKFITTTNYIVLFGKVICITVIFIALMFLIGFDSQEKRDVLGALQKLLRRRNYD